MDSRIGIVVCDFYSSIDGGVHLGSRFLRSCRARSHGVSHSWGSALLHPRLCIFSAFGARQGKTQSIFAEGSCRSFGSNQKVGAEEAKEL